MMNLAILVAVGYTSVAITDATTTTTLSTMRVGPRKLVHPPGHGFEFGRPAVNIRDVKSA